MRRLVVVTPVTVCALLVTAVAALLLATPAVAAPKVSKAGPAPVVIPATATLHVKAAASGKGRLSLVLSASARSARGGTVLKGSARAGRRAKVRGVVPRSIVPGERRYVLVCASAKQAVRGKPASCKSAGWAPTSAAGLSERLDAAVAAKRLSKGKAALYAFYATNRDPRLPPELHGAKTSERSTEELLHDAAVDFKSYPKSIRKELIWYFAPPSAPNSPWRQKTTKKGTTKVKVAKATTAGRAAPVAGAAARSRKAHCGGYYEILHDGPFNRSRHEDWIGLGTSDGKAIVWYQKGERAAEETAKQYRSALPAIWKKLAGEFRPPKSDAGVDCYHGPDGRFDVYVSGAMVFHGSGGRAAGRAAYGLGVAVPYPSAGVWCTNRPAWIAVKPGQRLWTLAHEFMHAVQFAYKYASCKEPIAWWDEGGATWAADFVYPDDGYEKKMFGYMIDMPLRYAYDIAGFSYWPYAFWMFLHRTQGTGVLRSIFAQLQSKRSVQAVDAAIPGGLARQWPRFAIHLWNNAPIGESGFPVRESFAQWDKHATPLPSSQVYDLVLGGSRELSIDLPIQNPKAIAPLSVAAYHRVTISDEQVREIKLENGLRGSASGKVEAMARLADGRWKLLEWSGKDPVLCRDKDEEDVQELIIVSSNAGPTATIPSFTHKLTGRSSCRVPIEFTGDLKVTTSAVNGTGLVSWTGSADLHLVLRRQVHTFFRAQPGSTWTATAEETREYVFPDPPCTVSGKSVFGSGGEFVPGLSSSVFPWEVGGGSGLAGDLAGAAGKGAAEFTYDHGFRKLPGAPRELRLWLVMAGQGTEYHSDGASCNAVPYDDYATFTPRWPSIPGETLELVPTITTDESDRLVFTFNIEKHENDGWDRHWKVTGALTATEWIDSEGG